MEADIVASHRHVRHLMIHCRTRTGDSACRRLRRYGDRPGPDVDHCLGELTRAVEDVVLSPVVLVVLDDVLVEDEDAVSVQQ